MKFKDLPAGCVYLDVDGVAVVRLPDESHVSFSPGGDGDSWPYLNGPKAALEGDHLSPSEFSDWLTSGKNRFDR